MVIPGVPRFLQLLLPGFIWRMPVQDKVLYLTFDDGPIPGVTPWVLDQLALHQAKATFFCIGRNCAANASILDRIRAEGHVVGNHTWDHPRGRRTPLRSYLRNVIAGRHHTSGSLFRPPYGSLTRAQARILRRRYRIVLWDVLSGDFDLRKSGLQCTRSVIAHARPGSIVVFHDSVKAWERLRIALPAVLAHFEGRGYRFDTLSALTEQRPPER